jgi:hypothetical protein
MKVGGRPDRSVARAGAANGETSAAPGGLPSSEVQPKRLLSGVHTNWPT